MRKTPRATSLFTVPVRFSVPVLVPVLVFATGCPAKIDGPVPSITELDPQIVCVDQLTTPITVDGSQFSPVPFEGLTDAPSLQLPTAVLVHEQLLDGSAAEGEVTFSGDASGDNANRLRWYDDSTMELTIDPELTLDTGVWGLTVTNPNSHQTSLENALLAVPPPVLDSVEPDLVCTDDGTRDVLLRGSDFLFIGDAAPSVDVGGIALEARFNDRDAECVVLPGPVADVRSCTTVAITVPASTLPGTYAVTLQNPVPAGCVTVTPRHLFIVPEPTVTSVVPEHVCMSGGDMVLTVSGSDFLDIDGMLPILTLDDGAAPILLTPEAVNMTGCVDYPDLAETIRPTETVRRCTGFMVILPQAPITDIIEYAATAENPAPAGCTSDAVRVINYPPPEIETPSAAAPLQICSGGAVEITGQNLRRGATVRIGGLAAGSVNVDPADCSCPLAACEDDGEEICTRLTASFDDFAIGALVGQTVDLVVENTDAVYAIDPAFACRDSEPSAIEVLPGPLLLYADPPILWDGFDNTVTLYATNFGPGGPVTHVEIVATDSEGNEIGDSPIELCDDGGLTPCSDMGGDSGAFTVVVPAGTLSQVTGAPATSNFLVRAFGSSACPASLNPALRIVSQPVAGTSMRITPAFGQVGTKTAITVELTPGPGGEVFVPTPRAYLTNASSGGPLPAVAYVRNNTLTAIVPDTFTLTCGTDCFEDFDLAVLNPDGTLFVEETAVRPAGDPVFRLSTFEPPRIDEITPGQLPAAGGNVQVVGTGFSNNGGNPTAELECTSATGASVPAGAVTVTFNGSTSLTLGMPSMPADIACVVKITNRQDEAFDRFSALVYGNSSGNIPAPRPALADDGVTSVRLNTARRAHGVAVAGATRAARFLYAAGGESAGGLLDSVEYTSLALTGETANEFTVARYSLGTPRSHFGLLQVGRALYAVGGQGAGGAALSSVERAVVLDPEEVVELGIDSFEFGSETSPGLPEGTWIYKVAVVFGPTDPISPCGESLPSEPFIIHLPNIVRGLRLTLGWDTPDTATPGTSWTGRVISGYRIYRTPVADAPIGDLRFLADVDGDTTVAFTDGADINAAATCESLGYDTGAVTCAPDCTLDDSGCSGLPNCGDGAQQLGETCDGQDLGLADCVSEGFAGGALACNATCDGFDTSGCIAPTCDGVALEPGEACDGAALGGASCASLGFARGLLACNATCTGFDTGGCVASTCGDGAAEGTEPCDGQDLAGNDCTSAGFASGTLACNLTCTGFDISACIAPVCDGVLAEGGELCDGSDLLGTACIDFGFTGGTLSCNGTCDGFDVSGCTGAGCGNGILDGFGELCDGADFGGLGCGDFGFVGGALACAADCGAIDTSGCTAPTCGDGLRQGFEACDGVDFGGTVISACANEPPFAVPLATGETSRWVEVGVPQLDTGRRGAATRAVRDKASSNVFLYAVTGLDGASAGLDDYELLVLAHDPTTNPIAWEQGASWQRTTGVLGTTCGGGDVPRWQAGAFLFNQESSSLDGISFEITDDDQYLYVGPGLAGTTIGTATGSFESWQITPTTGVLNAATYSGVCRNSANMAGYGNIGANQQVFTFGGSDFSDSIRAVAWTVTANRITIDSSFNNNGGGRLTTPRYLAGTVLDRAFIYMVGGQGAAPYLDTLEFGLW